MDADKKALTGHFVALVTAPFGDWLRTGNSQVFRHFPSAFICVYLRLN
jgi:hypothetical protein